MAATALVGVVGVVGLIVVGRVNLTGIGNRSPIAHRSAIRDRLAGSDGNGRAVEIVLLDLTLWCACDNGGRGNGEPHRSLGRDRSDDIRGPNWRYSGATSSPLVVMSCSASSK